MSCASYRPGHCPHWIQAKKSHEPGQPVIEVKVIAVYDDGRVDIEGADLELTLWYHVPSSLRRAVGSDAQWKPKYHVLSVVSGGLFSLASPGKVTPCVPPISRHPAESTRQFIERAMRGYYGYTVPARWLVDLDAVPDGDTDDLPWSCPLPIYRYCFEGENLWN